MPDEMTPLEVVYAGARLSIENKLCDAFIALVTLEKIAPSETDLLRRMLAIFDRGKKNRGADRLLVGAVYRMPVLLENDVIKTARLAGLEFVRRLSDDPRTVAWQATHEAAEAEYKRKRLVAKIAASGPLSAELEHLRDAYRHTPYQDRLAFELMILNAIRRGL